MNGTFYKSSTDLRCAIILVGGILASISFIMGIKVDARIADIGEEARYQEAEFCLVEARIDVSTSNPELCESDSAVDDTLNDEDKIEGEDDSKICLIFDGSSYESLVEEDCEIPSNLKLQDGLNLLTPTSWPLKGKRQIKFILPEACWVRIDIFDLNGEGICTLVDDFYEKGEYCCYWDTSEHSSFEIPEGLYLVSMEGYGLKEVRRMILVE